MQTKIEQQQTQFNIVKEEYIKLLNDKEVLLNWGKTDGNGLLCCAQNNF